MQKIKTQGNGHGLSVRRGKLLEFYLIYEGSIDKSNRFAVSFYVKMPSQTSIEHTVRHFEENRDGKCHLKAYYGPAFTCRFDEQGFSVNRSLFRGACSEMFRGHLQRI